MCPRTSWTAKVLVSNYPARPLRPGLSLSPYETLALLV